MKFRRGAPPENESFDPEARGFAPIREPGPVLLQFFAIPVAVITCGAVMAVFHFLSPIRLNQIPDRLPPLTFLASMVAIIIVHELLHALAHPGSGRSDRTVLGVWPSRGLAYAHWEGELTRDRFLLVFVMPSLVLSVLPMVLAVAQLDWWPLAVIAVINTGLACGDYLGVLLIAWQVPRAAVVQNKGWRTYYRLPG